MSPRLVTVVGRWSASLSPKPAFGWAMAFTVPRSAGVGSRSVNATLSAPAPLGIRAAELVEIALWVAAVAFVILDIRKRRNEDPDPEVVRPEWFVPVSPAADRRNWRSRGSSQALGSEDMSGDEVWVDV
jgi:hypothetical protein